MLKCDVAMEVIFSQMAQMCTERNEQTISEMMTKKFKLIFLTTRFLRSQEFNL